jgi:hypothetical protein
LCVLDYINLYHLIKINLSRFEVSGKQEELFGNK